MRSSDENRQIPNLMKPRSGWEEALKEMANRGDDQLLDETRHSLTIWDDQECEW